MHEATRLCHQLTIQACGRPEPTVVSDCPRDCIYVQYGAGLLSWYDGELNLRVARTGKQYSWLGGYAAPIAHTRRWVFLHRCQNQFCRVLAAKIPR